MVEEFDAASHANLIGAISVLLGLVLLGGALEFGPLRWARRRALATGKLFGEVIFSALSGQALFWGGLIGLRLTSDDLFPKLSDQMRSAILFAAILSVVILVVRLATNWVRFTFVRLQIGSFSLINNLLRFLGGLVITATILGFYGVPVGGLLTLVAGSSLGLTLALRDPLANLFSGMVVIASSKIRPGDYVRLSSGEEGYVTDIRWADTYIRQISNNLIIVPNSLITNTIMINYSRPEPEMAVLLTMGVSYNSNLDRVEELVIAVASEVMEEVPGGVPDFTPMVRYNTFNESSIDFMVVMRGKSFNDQFLIKHEFIKRLRSCFQAEGISIPFPIRTITTAGPIPIQIQEPDSIRTPTPNGQVAGDGRQASAS